jgi:hypothetical protein
MNAEFRMQNEESVILSREDGEGSQAAESHFEILRSRSG